MNIFAKTGCRIIQQCFRLALPVLPYRNPIILNHLTDITSLLIKKNISSVLLITDQGLRGMGYTKALEDALTSNPIRLTVYDKTCANPTVINAEEAKELYLQENCQAIIAFGGGSPMDCAKAAGALIAYPKKSIGQLKGLLKVWRKLPPFIAIPTTAGTGSEVTLTAVITDSIQKHKYTMNSFPLIPHYAVLDAQVTCSLPPHLTATTGMDALTHAVEAYIGNSTIKQTGALALEATRLIFENLPKAYRNGNDLDARRNMLLASHKAGIAFSKSYVGYIHAVAHSLGGQYNIPHGLANAVLLPVFLEDYGSCIHEKLKDLAVAAGIAGENEQARIAARKFIKAIRNFNEYMNIPADFPQIKREDIPQMARHAAAEANPLYPVPKLMSRNELEYYYEFICTDTFATIHKFTESAIRKELIHGHS